MSISTEMEYQRRTFSRPNFFASAELITATGCGFMFSDVVADGDAPKGIHFAIAIVHGPQGEPMVVAVVQHGGFGLSQD